MDNLNAFAQLLQKAERIAVLTGAGISTESGIPDFRSPQGIYSTITSEEIFDTDVFCEDPGRFYKIMSPLYSAIFNARPNAGHLALKQLADMPGKTVTITTQNIDSLHLAAGSPNVREIHGALTTLICLNCLSSLPLAGFQESCQRGEILRCPCGGTLKPDIIFFGDLLPMEAIMDAEQDFRNCDLALVLGTSLTVYPAARLPTLRPASAPLVIINRTATSLDNEATLLFHEGIGDTLSQAVALLR